MQRGHYEEAALHLRRSSTYASEQSGNKVPDTEADKD